MAACLLIRLPFDDSLCLSLNSSPNRLRQIDRAIIWRYTIMWRWVIVCPPKFFSFRLSFSVIVSVCGLYTMEFTLWTYRGVGGFPLTSSLSSASLDVRCHLPFPISIIWNSIFNVNTKSSAEDHLTSFWLHTLQFVFALFNLQVFPVCSWAYACACVKCRQNRPIPLARPLSGWNRRSPAKPEELPIKFPRHRFERMLACQVGGGGCLAVEKHFASIRLLSIALFVGLCTLSWSKTFRLKVF